MKDLLIQLRAMQLFTHSAHNLVARTPFHTDHSFFGDVYSVLESDYDDVAERIIGLFGEEPMELNSILMGVAAKLQGAPSIGVRENSVFYSHLLSQEIQLCEHIKKLVLAGISPGTEQLIGDIANKSESRQYKIKQRLKK